MKIIHINSYYSGSFFYKNLYDRQIEDKLDIDVYVPVANGFESSKLDLGVYSNISHNQGRYDRLFFHVKHKKIYNDILKQYTVSHKIQRVKTSDFGALFEIIYCICLKDDVDQKAFIDKLRCRNGNLSIVLNTEIIDEKVYI